MGNGAAVRHGVGAHGLVGAPWWGLLRRHQTKGFVELALGWPAITARMGGKGMRAPAYSVGTYRGARKDTGAGKGPMYRKG